MGFLTKAFGILKKIKGNLNQPDQPSSAQSIISMVAGFGKIKIILAISPFVIVGFILLVVTVSEAADLQQVQMNDLNSYEYEESTGGISINGSNPNSILTEQDRKKIVEAALAQVGKPYSHSNNEAEGFDCNGLASYAYTQAGFPEFRDGSSNRPENSWSCNQLPQIIQTERDKLLPGDIIGWSCPDTNCPNWSGPGGRCSGGPTGRHIAIYIGNDQMVEALDYNSGIVVNPVRDYWIAGPLV